MTARTETALFSITALLLAAVTLAAAAELAFPTASPSGVEAQARADRPAVRAAVEHTVRRPAG